MELHSSMPAEEKAVVAQLARSVAVEPSARHGVVLATLWPARVNGTPPWMAREWHARIDGWTVGSLLSPQRPRRARELPGAGMMLRAAVRPRGATGLSRFGTLHSRPLHLLFGTANKPHPDKKDKGGEDAFFADPALGAFGVADGVGGSARQGVDPGVFSRRMLSLCHGHLAENPAQQPSAAHLTRAMEASGAELARSPIGGSSTLLLGQLDSSTSQLSLVNLGDSAAMLLRPAPRRFARAGTILWPRIVARTNEQTHYFNCPYQVGADDMSHTVREGEADEIQARLAAPRRPGLGLGWAGLG